MKQLIATLFVASFLLVGFASVAHANPDSCDVTIDFDQYAMPLQFGGAAGNMPGDEIFAEYGWPFTIHNMAGSTFFGTVEIDPNPPMNTWQGNALLVNSIALEMDVSGSKPEAAFIPFLDGTANFQKELIVNGIDVLSGIGNFSNSVTWTVGNLQLQIGVGALGNSGFNLGGICIYGPIETIRIGGEELWIDNVCFGSFGVMPAALSAMASMAGNNDCETFVDFDQPPFPGAQWSVASGTAAGDLMFTEGGYEFGFTDLVVGGGMTVLNEIAVAPGPTPVIVNDGLRFNNASFKAAPLGMATDYVSFYYYYGGGITNLEVNGFMAPSGAEPSLWNGLNLGGVDVVVDWVPTPFGEEGQVRLSGDVDVLVLGGQEFWIDNLCLGQAQTAAVQGCTNPMSINFNPSATIDNGTCIIGVNPPPAACQNPCDQYLDFDALGLGATWQEPTLMSGMQLFDLSGFPVTADVLLPVMDVNGDGVLDFTDGPGSSYVQTVPSPWPSSFGPASGIVLRTANAQVKLDLSSLPNGTQEVCFSILDLGGIDNFAINGSPLVITSFDLDGDGYMDTPFYGGQETLNGSTIGGVNVIASPVPNYLPSGQVQGMRIDFRLLGDVDQLTLGGQEYFIGPICVQEGQATAVQSCEGDLTDDGAVGVDDLLSLLGVYGNTCN